MMFISFVEMMTKLSMMNVKPTTECFEKSVRAKCFAEMPLCGPINERGQVTKRRLCRSECEELFHYCKGEITGECDEITRIFQILLLFIRHYLD